VRTLGGILIILVGLAWEFSDKLHIFIGQVTIQKWQDGIYQLADREDRWVSDHCVLTPIRGLGL